MAMTEGGVENLLTALRAIRFKYTDKLSASVFLDELISLLSIVEGSVRETPTTDPRCEISAHARELFEIIDREGLAVKVLANYLTSFDSRKCCGVAQSTASGETQIENGFQVKDWPEGVIEAMDAVKGVEPSAAPEEPTKWEDEDTRKALDVMANEGMVSAEAHPPATQPTYTNSPQQPQYDLSAVGGATESGRCSKPNEHHPRNMNFCTDCIHERKMATESAATQSGASATTIFDESMREALVDEAVAKWLDGPEEIDAFCDWLILETVRRLNGNV